MNRIEEPAEEAFLYRLWVDRPLTEGPLYTVDGRPVEILEKGIRNRDAGPDFLDALVRIDGLLLRGDVEIHPLAGDWYAHGHHRDPKYNRVVLHVVTLHCPPEFRTVKQDGALVATLNLDDYLEKSAEELEAEQDEEPGPSGACALGKQKDFVVQRVLDRAGDLRLVLKAERFRERPAAQSWDQAFYETLLEALGYAKNRIPFRRLAAALPVEELWNLIWSDPEETALRKSEAVLFGLAGLLPDSTKEPYVAELQALRQSFPQRLRIDALNAEAWQFFRLRPANFPTRRIDAAAALVCRFRTEGFISAFVKAIGEQTVVKKAVSELENLLTLESSGFWRTHYTFEEEAGTVEGMLLGGERARDIVVNAALPAMLAFAQESMDGRLKNTVMEIYRCYPKLAANEQTRSACRRIFGDDREPPLVNGARRQQGLIHLRKERCRMDDCSACLVSDGGFETAL